MAGNKAVIEPVDQRRLRWFTVDASSPTLLLIDFACRSTITLAAPKVFPDFQVIVPPQTLPHHCPVGFSSGACGSGSCCSLFDPLWADVSSCFRRVGLDLHGSVIYGSRCHRDVVFGRIAMSETKNSTTPDIEAGELSRSGMVAGIVEEGNDVA
jgi:hypothetical protein